MLAIIRRYSISPAGRVGARVAPAFGFLVLLFRSTSGLLCALLVVFGCGAMLASRLVMSITIADVFADGPIVNVGNATMHGSCVQVHLCCCKVCLECPKLRLFGPFCGAVDFEVCEWFIYASSAFA